VTSDECRVTGVEEVKGVEGVEKVEEAARFAFSTL
jgi:hypothetical protein